MTSLRNWINYTLSFEAVGLLVAASYKDFHAKGLNYLYLHRSPSHIVKIYLFDGEVRALLDGILCARKQTSPKDSSAAGVA